MLWKAAILYDDLQNTCDDTILVGFRNTLIPIDPSAFLFQLKSK